MEEFKQKLTWEHRMEMMDELESYELSERDLKGIMDEIIAAKDSGILDPSIFPGLRFTTSDLKNWYVITDGKHISRDGIHVEEMNVDHSSGLRVFKIPRTDLALSKDPEERREKIYEIMLCGKGGIQGEVVYETADVKENEEVDGLYLPSPLVHEKYNSDSYDYTTDLMFHELGHKQQHKLAPMDEDNPFGSPEKREIFISAIMQSGALPDELLSIIAGAVNGSAMSEMCAMMVDREAKRRLGKHIEELEDDRIILENLANTRESISKSFEEEKRGKRQFSAHAIHLIRDIQFLKDADTKKLPIEILNDLKLLFKDKFWKPSEVLTRKWVKENHEWKLTRNPGDQKIIQSNIIGHLSRSTCHMLGRTLATIIEKVFPDYQERKNWVFSLMQREKPTSA